MSDAPTWFEDDLRTDAPRRRRRLLLVALVATSWVVLALVLVRGQSPAPGTTPASETGPAGLGAPATDGADATSPPPDDPADPDPADPDPGDPDAPAAAEEFEAEVGDAPIGRDEAEAVVVAVLRGWLSDGGPDLQIPGVEIDRRAYLEHVALEAFDVPSDEVAVARVLLVLLIREDDHYTEAVVRRAAVPLTLTTTSVHPGGSPWWLPTAPDLTPAPPGSTPVTSPETVADVTTALADAGYQHVRVADVAATAGGTLVAEVTARTPDGDPVDGSVWLHPSPAGLLVLGGPHTDADTAATDDDAAAADDGAAVTDDGGPPD